MRIRSINYFERRLTDKKDMKLSSLPRSFEEEQNFQIAYYFTNLKNKNNKNTKVA